MTDSIDSARNGNVTTDALAEGNGPNAMMDHVDRLFQDIQLEAAEARQTLESLDRERVVAMARVEACREAIVGRLSRGVYPYRSVEPLLWDMSVLVTAMDGIQKEVYRFVSSFAAMSAGTQVTLEADSPIQAPSSMEPDRRLQEITDLVAALTRMAGEASRVARSVTVEAAQASLVSKRLHEAIADLPNRVSPPNAVSGEANWGPDLGLEVASAILPFMDAVGKSLDTCSGHIQQVLDESSHWMERLVEGLASPLATSE